MDDFIIYIPLIICVKQNDNCFCQDYANSVCLHRYLFLLVLFVTGNVFKFIGGICFVFNIFCTTIAYAQTENLNKNETLPTSDLPYANHNNEPKLANIDRNFFYFNQPYGSESQFGPLNVWVNVGLVVPGRLGTQPQLDEINYAKGWQHLKSSLKNQRDVLDESGGTNESLKKEFIPFAHPSGAWLPNYFLHLLGEGMLSRKLEEYYLSQEGNSPLQAKIKAIITLAAAQATNEVVEYELPWEQRLDPLADFYFNLAGIIAFSFDEVAQLFSNDYLDYYYWPGQPIIDLQDGALFNQGEQYYFRSKLGFDTQTSLAIISGMPATGLGISYPVTMDDQLSVLFATDVAVSHPHETVDSLERGTDFTASEIAKLYNQSLNIYWDKKGSLMGSVALSYHPFYQVSMNLYPLLYQLYLNFLK